MRDSAHLASIQSPVMSAVIAPPKSGREAWSAVMSAGLIEAAGSWQCKGKRSYGTLSTSRLTRPRRTSPRVGVLPATNTLYVDYVIYCIYNARRPWDSI